MKKTSLTISLLTMGLIAFGQGKKIKEYGIGLYNLNSFSLQHRWGTENSLYRVLANIDFKSSNGTDKTVNNSIASNYVTNADSKSPFNISLGLGFSKLFLKNFNENFGMVFGPSIGISYSYSKESNSKTVDTAQIKNVNVLIQYPSESLSSSLVPNLGFVLGFFYNLNSKFYIYGEVQPNIYFKISNNKQTYTGTSYNNINPSTLPPTYVIETSTNTIEGEEKTFGITGIGNGNAMLSFVYRISK